MTDSKFQLRGAVGALFSSAAAGVGAGWGMLTLGGMGAPLAASVGAICFLAGVLLAFRGKVEEFSGAVFVVLGITVVLHFWDVILIGGDDFSVAAVGIGVALGGMMVAVGKRNSAGTALVTLLLFYGATGTVSRALIGSDSVCWIYEPEDRGAGRLVAAEPCYVVESSSGELQIVPGGHWGILPLHPKTEHVGKKAGPFLIVGVLEIGGMVHGVGDGKFAQLDFSMVSPGRGGGVGVIRNPLLPSI